jgi:hypothetical protein
MNATILDFCTHFGKGSLADVYTSQTPTTKGLMLLDFGEVPDDLQNDVNGLNAYKAKNFAKVISARNDLEFIRLRDEMIAEMASYNVDEIFKYFYNEALKQGDRVAKLFQMMKN